MTEPRETTPDTAVWKMDDPIDNSDDEPGPTTADDVLDLLLSTVATLCCAAMLALVGLFLQSPPVTDATDPGFLPAVTFFGSIVMGIFALLAGILTVVATIIVTAKWVKRNGMRVIRTRQP